MCVLHHGSKHGLEATTPAGESWHTLGMVVHLQAVSIRRCRMLQRMLFFLHLQAAMLHFYGLHAPDLVSQVKPAVAWSLD